MVTKTKAKKIQLKKILYLNLKVIKTNSSELNSLSRFSYTSWCKVYGI